MKILVLADKAEPRLWEHLDRRLLDGVSLVISCGDLPARYLSFLTCFTRAPILYVHGNHDIRYDREPPEGCECIEDTVYVFQGIRILGLGGSMRYRPEAAHQYSEREMLKRVRRLKLRLSIFRNGGIDILVTHAPARGIGDDSDLAHRGFETFLRVMDRYRPRYMLHGHMHIEYTHDFRRERRYNATAVINACGYCYIDYPDMLLTPGVVKGSAPPEA